MLALEISHRILELLDKMLHCVLKEKEALQETMKREVSLLRMLLTSLSDECNAIKREDTDMFDNVMEERISLISSFEKMREELIALTIKLAKNAEVSLTRSGHLCHSEAVELLEECIDSDDFELHFLREQILALMQQIHTQNAINAARLRDGASEKWVATLQPQAPLRSKPKSIIAVIDH